MKNNKFSDDCIITLVHGTWAKKTTWIESESIISNYLKANLPGKTTIAQFKWSGKNSHHARIRASDKLVEHVLHTKKLYPNSHQFIIGHSHGGNVALYAAKNSTVKDNVNTIVCLATPFINSKTRNIGQSLLFARWFASFYFSILSLGIMFLISHYLSDFIINLTSFKRDNIDLIFVISTAFMTIGFGCFIFDIFSPSNSIHKYLEGLQNKFMHSISYSNISSPKIISLSMKGDEAKGYLKFLFNIAEFPLKFWGKRNYIILLVLTIIAYMITFWPYILEAINYIPNQLPHEPGRLNSRGEIILFVIVNCTLRGLLSSVMAVMSFQFFFLVWTKFIKGNLISFGSSSLWTNWLVSINISKKCPIEGSYNIDSFTHEEKGLKHSQIYTHSATLRTVSAWIHKMIYNT